MKQEAYPTASSLHDDLKSMSFRLPNRAVKEPPQGLRYQPNFISNNEERSLLRELKRLDFQEIKMKGMVAKRKTQHFGWGYGYESWALLPAPKIPQFLTWLVVRAAEWAKMAPDLLEEALITHYPAGAGIGWHRDARVFGNVIGISLGSRALMKFRKTTTECRLVYTLELAPCSAYLMSDEARSIWQHSIPACPQERYSITLRTLRRNKVPNTPPLDQTA